MGSRVAVALVLLALALGPTPAAAQQRSLDVERFRPAPDRYGFLGIPGTRTPGPWAWNVALWTGYSLEPLTLRRLDDGTRLPVVRHRASGDFLAQLGITDRLGLVLNVPVVLWQDTDAELLGTGPPLAALAVRDPYVAARVRILGEGATVEHGSLDGPGLAVQVATTLPFGLEQSFAGEGAPQLEAAVIGDFHLLSLGVGAILGYRHRFAEPRLLGVRFANELFFGAAIQVPTLLLERVDAIVEVRVDTALDDGGFVGASTAVEGDLGLRWHEGDLMMTWLVGTGLVGGVGAPAFRATYGISFAPRTHDLDGDGISDEAERPECMRLPEDFDGFEDEDGCADPDNDGDLVPDRDDRCPNEAAEAGRDDDDDGCTDPVRDADRDGVPDAEDSCPREAEDRDGFEDDDGCPDVDDDLDEVLDRRDRCPREAEDRDGFEDDDGCPDPDDDGDGVGDADDACPRVAEDRDGHDDADGCPDPDDDRDGVVDADDRCPDERETIDGLDDDDGCPDRGRRPLWTPTSADALPELRGTLRFTSAGELAPTAGPAIEQLRRHLVARWGGRWRVALGEGAPARVDALRAALTAEVLAADAFEVVVDPALRGARVELRRPADAGARAPAEP
jgi:hypothetical protein